MATVDVKIEGPVRTVTLNRPEKRNALDGAMMEELEAIFRMAPKPEERVAVIRANGPVFCAGLDLKWRARHPQGEYGI